MSYCINPNCSNPIEQTSVKLCLNCQTLTLLNDRYRILKIIGQGGMGKTFLAVDEQNDGDRHFCVVKQFFPQARDINSCLKAQELFEVEIDSLKKLGRHPQIPEFYSYFSQNKHQYLVQEWIDGENLTQIINKQGFFTEIEIRNLLTDLLPVLGFVHQDRIIHRDIKPENIILNSNNKLVLVDFGAAKILDSKLLQKTGTIIGSAEYVSPEQLRGKAIASSDIFSLGVSCLYLLTGISPFNLYSDFEDAWVWRDYLGENKVSQELGQILDRMIARAISQRYRSISEILSDLKISANMSQRLAVSPQNPAEEIVKIDFNKLQSYLASEQWQLANKETELLLLKAANCENSKWLERDDIQKISCENLYTINQLWEDYSDERFGFRIQAKIWQGLEPKNYRLFGKQVGWYVETRWLLTKNLEYTISAPKGHLPAINWWYGHAIWGLKGLFNKIDTCDACFTNFKV